MRLESIQWARREATQTATALLEALERQDAREAEAMAIRVQALARLEGLDSWTEERLDVLGAVASAVSDGTAQAGALSLLAHVAHGLARPAKVM